MSEISNISEVAMVVPSAQAVATSGPTEARDALGDAARVVLKTTVHRELIRRMDLERLTGIQADEAGGRQRLLAIVLQLIAEQGAPLSAPDRDRLARDILDEVFGLGPLEPLLHDPTVNDILVNTYRTVYVERRGIIEKTDIVFEDEAHLMHIIDKIVSAVGRRIDESAPMVDARLLDGSRVNIVIPPLAVDGPLVSIRRFGSNPLTADDLVRYRALTPQMLELLRGAVRARLNIVVSGGTGSGKTTLLNVLSGFISDDERVVTIEDAAELKLRQRHVVRLETRPANIEGKGEVRQRQLMINALRMRPDRIVVGEVRGEEALDMLQAMNTGHDGSLTTIHANSPRDALYRLDTMVAMANLNIPERAVRQQIASAVNLVIQATRLSDGSRRVTAISELTGMEGDVITVQDLFLFERTGISPDRKVLGRFKACGIRPKCSEKLAASGFNLPIDMFEQIEYV
jgi:pilus assembly protein CpaF